MLRVDVQHQMTKNKKEENLATWKILRKTILDTTLVKVIV
jgi:hypothetical protein